MDVTPEMLALVGTLFTGSVGFGGLWLKERSGLKKEKQERVAFETSMRRDEFDFEKRLRDGFRTELERLQNSYFDLHRKLESEVNDRATMRLEITRLSQQVDGLLQERRVLKLGLDKRDREITQRDRELVELRNRLSELELRYEISEAFE